MLDLLACDTLREFGATGARIWTACLASSDIIVRCLSPFQLPSLFRCPSRSHSLLTFPALPPPLRHYPD